jgi:hypothetical protein
MLYRPTIAALTLLACVLVTVSLSKAEPLTQCIAKDQIIATVVTKSGEGIFFRKVTGGGAQALKSDMEANGLTDVGESYVIFWKDGERNNMALIAIFDEHNCFDRVVSGKKEEVLKITSGVGA